MENPPWTLGKRKQKRFFLNRKSIYLKNEGEEKGVSVSGEEIFFLGKRGRERMEGFLLQRTVRLPSKREKKKRKDGQGGGGGDAGHMGRTIDRDES